MREGMVTLVWLMAACGMYCTALAPPMASIQNNPWLSSMEEVQEGELPEESLEEDLQEEKLLKKEIPPEERKPSVVSLEAVSEEGCSIKVSWTINGAIDDIKLRYQEVKGGQEVTVESPISPHTIESLYPNTTYRISIQIAFNDFTELGGKHKVSTTAALGPAPPTDLTAIPGRSNVSLDWEATDTPCRLSGYRVRYAGDILWSEDFCNGTMEQPGNTTTSDLTSLVPYTNYSICVSAWTEDSQSKKFFSNDTCTNVQTKEDTPGAPTDLQHRVETETSMVITWKPPEEKNGILLGYTVTWLLQEKPSSPNHIIVTNETQATLSNLLVCLRYHVSVRTATVAGEGPAGLGQWQTDPQEPPPHPSKVSCESKSSTSITTQWSPPANYTCTISTYKGFYSGEILWSNEAAKGEINSQTGTSYVAKNLVPWSNYSFCIKTIVGDKESTEESCCSARTNSASPSKPLDVQAYATGCWSIRVTWSPPEEINGRHLTYIVTLDSDDLFCVRSDTSCDIDGLESSTWYYVSVQAANADYKSEAVFVGVTTDKDVAVVVVAVIVPLVLVVVAGGLTFRNWRRLKQYLDSRRDHRASLTPENVSMDDYLQGGPKMKDQLQDHIKISLKTEFEDLPPKRETNASCSVASLHENIDKNRYTDILPYDSNRVPLKRGMHANSTGYINASFVFGRRFIVTQDPSFHTQEDLWQAIWEHRVKMVIVLPSSKTGSSRIHFPKYWPDKGDEWCIEYARLRIKNLDETLVDNFIVRKLLITNPKGTISLRVDHLQLTSTAEHEVFKETCLLLVTHARKIARGSLNPQGPVLLHCGSGSGTTGVVIGLWKLLEDSDSGYISGDLYRVVEEMRWSRPGMISTEKQYKFMHTCLCEYQRNPALYSVP